MVVMVPVPAKPTMMAAGSAHAPVAPTPVAAVRPSTATIAPAATWKTGLCIDVFLILLFHERSGIELIIRHLELVLFGVHLRVQLVFDLSERTPGLRVAAVTR